MSGKSQEIEKWKKAGYQFVSLREGKDKWIVGIFPESLNEYPSAIQSLAISVKELVSGFKDTKF